METQTNITRAGKGPHPLVWVAAIALIVFCGAGVGAIMGWIPTSIGTPADPAAPLSGKPSTAPAKLAAERAPAAKAAAATATAAAVAPVAAAKCAECGVVQSVREIDSKGPGGSGVGVIGGAVVGGLLGNQIGDGDGKKIATVVGAVGGAVAGNEIEKRVHKSKSFEITVRFDDGTTRAFTEADATTWRNGDRVRIVNGRLQSNA